MGVKSLWSLLDPVGRPVLLETMEGKSMAIDSSIWIYQFQATMRDKEGRGLVNAHVLGFLRRICKLLFYGIKPVFVFDGGAPALKRATIAERRKKKSGAALSHTKLAERLLAAQLRREALKQVQTKSGGSRKGKVPDGPVVVDENTVYLEDVDDSLPKTPAKRSQAEAAEVSPPSSKKKSRWHDHDPYKLPDVNLDEAIAKATRSAAPDPRLATEDELRAFIEDMRPEDFDVTSPEFRELPTEVQYEIIGDLRLKSRQTSYKRLQNMLRNARTPLDFSKEQIKNLKNRNALTQQLLVTTDTIGKEHVSIPIRIASERNREYVLIKNESGDGGWVLGIRDEGTRSKPIKIDHVSDQEKADDESEDDMEEVKIVDKSAIDPDLREHRRGQALAALANRYSPKKLAPLTTKVRRKPRNVRPLFAPEEETAHLADGNEEEDPELEFAIQESLEYQEEVQLRQALQASRSQVFDFPVISDTGASTSRVTLTDIRPSTPEAGLSRVTSETGFPNRDALESDDEDLYASPTRLETALSIANASSAKRSLSQAHRKSGTSQSTFGPPTFLLPLSREVESLAPVQSMEDGTMSDSEEDMEEVSLTRLVDIPMSVLSTPHTSPVGGIQHPIQRNHPVLQPASVVEDEDEDEEMEDVLPSIANPLARGGSPDNVVGIQQISPPLTTMLEHQEDASQITRQSLPDPAPNSTLDTLNRTLVDTGSTPGRHDNPRSFPAGSEEPLNPEAADSADEYLDPWAHPSHSERVPIESTPDGWDAAEEMDPGAEEGEFARFLSQVKGKDIDTVRREIDEEIRVLHQQKKAAMRDSEDVTQQMVSQIMIMLRLFGIPYITAPMEAEAQCAELLALGLVDGIITDDSDVFLFGGLRVLKNMFNQSKTVECFLLSDLERELGLDRDKLIRLAYLLGSDYTEGLPGVGPVVAMELLNEFPGQDGLHKFKDWWQKVQSGQDTQEDTSTSFRKRFKTRFKDLYLPQDWPNPAVRDAYYHPTVDASEEPFKWGFPDLDALRNLFNSELGWHQWKVDDLLLPIIHKMGKRGQSSALNKQGNLAGFFDIPMGGAAPRKRQAYASKRLQQVVSNFRKERATAQTMDSIATEEEDSESVSLEAPTKRRKTARNGQRRDRATGGTKKANRNRPENGSRRGKSKKTARKGKASEASEDEVDITTHPAEFLPQLAVSLRPRPKPAYKGTDPSTNISDHGEST